VLHLKSISLNASFEVMYGLDNLPSKALELGEINYSKNNNYYYHHYYGLSA